MLSFREIASAFRQLAIEPDRPVLVHASLSAFGEVRGGADTLLGALLASFGGVMAPAFTYKTMLIPEVGPQDNGLVYGSGGDPNRMAEFFRPDLAVDHSLGILAETLRQQGAAHRSRHPILSFSGIHADPILEAQSLQDPFGPLAALAERSGWVLLLGVNQTVNTSIHFAEQLAGLPRFTRWALTYQGVVECPNFPGCSRGFDRAGLWLSDLARTIHIGGALIHAYPLEEMVERLVARLRQQPDGLLCDRPDCVECSSIRRRLSRPEEKGRGG